MILNPNTQSMQSGFYSSKMCQIFKLIKKTSVRAKRRFKIKGNNFDILQIKAIVAIFE
jgi:hypothetical protein